MKAIKITQELKDLNPFLQGYNIGEIKKLNLPNSFKFGDFNYLSYPTRTDLHLQHGWKEVINPSYNTSTQRLGNLIDNPNDSDTFTYEVINLSEEQIKNRIKGESEVNKQELIQQKLEEQVVSEAQALDDEEAANNIDIYPFWEVGQTYSLNEKCKYIVGQEIWLFKINQPTLVTDELNPPPTDVNSNALYTRIAFTDEPLDWVQPTGAHDAYNTGDQVIYPAGSGIVWESTVDANVFAPGVVAGQWIEI